MSAELSLLCVFHHEDGSPPTRRHLARVLVRRALLGLGYRIMQLLDRERLEPTRSAPPHLELGNDPPGALSERSTDRVVPFLVFGYSLVDPNPNCRIGVNSCTAGKEQSRWYWDGAVRLGWLRRRG
jgi:hypothetical protein